MGKKTNLKALLSDFQEKQRKAQLQKAKEAAKKDVLKKKNSGRLSANSKGKRPETMPFFPSDTILLIGEGNFSFARAFFTSEHEALTHLPPANVTATTYDSEETCYEKYPDAKQIVQELREKGVVVLFEVDARKLSSHKELKKRKWKRIVWNFPHAGAFISFWLILPSPNGTCLLLGKGISDQDRNILSNQVLLLDFLKSAAPLLEGGAIPSMSSRNSQMKKKTLTGSDDEGDDMVVDMAPTQMKERGTILITLRNGHPYTLW